MSLAPPPDRIRRLNELAYDLWWAWNPQARQVFRYLDYPLWRLTAHNPVRMLRLVARERLEEAAKETSFLTLYDAAIQDLDRARVAASTWWSQEFPDLSNCSIAYFSAEFAFHQSLPIYAGGLGVLAGDHCKEASDVGLPFIGVGFMYPQGYFHQNVTAEGWQVELYERLNWDDAPVERAVRLGGQPCIVEVPLGGKTVRVSVWLVRLGRVKLYLLDTDLEENAPWDRELSARLYGGDSETRVRQEVVLGVGGVRALRMLGHDPAVWHMNEGHTAFLVIERMRELLERGESFEGALEQVRRTTVFTTHTPVPAGHDAFPFRLVENYLAGLWRSLGSHRNAFLNLGHYDRGDGPLFNMTALALRASGAVNAVSRLHRQETSKMWAPIWPGKDDADRPVKAVTNGIHISTWIAPAMSDLFDRYLGREWRERQEEPGFWDAILSIPDEELWAARQSLRSYLFTFMRERARQRWMDERPSPSRIVAGGTLLDPASLTLGFARRFTGYKRAELIFRDPARLSRILTAPRSPVQIVFAGKAHPADEPGKHLLQRVYRNAVDPAFGGRIAFVDDYDLHVAHFLVQGCDVWLNNPRKPLEACGTSGMKASLNGVINLSVGDGWWAEGYKGSNGWLIDGGVVSNDANAVDAADSEALYRLLEEQVVPTFYERDEHGVAKRWLQIVREAIRTVAPHFSSRRMVKEYAEGMYVPMARRYLREKREQPAT